MGFLRNLTEDCESFLANTLAEKRFLKLDNAEKKLQALKTSLNYRRADLIFLVQKEYNYNNKSDLWFKEEDFDYGKFPGKYKISLKFPDDYPESPPIIKAKPLFERTKTRRISPHIMSDYRMCIATKKHGGFDSYWKSNLNARGALTLTYNIITDNVYDEKKSRKEMSIKGTIFQSLTRVVSVKIFIKEFLKSNNITTVDETWKWTEIAYKISTCSQKIKVALVKYYNNKKQQKGKKKDETKLETYKSEGTASTTN